MSARDRSGREDIQRPRLRRDRHVPERAQQRHIVRLLRILGAEVYVLETITGWSNILPKSLALTPPDDGGFWIPSSEVP